MRYTTCKFAYALTLQYDRRVIMFTTIFDFPSLVIGDYRFHILYVGFYI